MCCLVFFFLSIHLFFVVHAVPSLHHSSPHTDGIPSSLKGFFLFLIYFKKKKDGRLSSWMSDEDILWKIFVVYSFGLWWPTKVETRWKPFFLLACRVALDPSLPS